MTEKIKVNDFTLAKWTSHGAISNNKRKSAFTLAEVLITLGIIGVIAAMTIPAVINSTQNKEKEISLKKNYSLLQQALLSMSNEYGQKIVPGLLTRSEFKEMLEKQFLIMKQCGYGSNQPSACVPNLSEDFISTTYKTLNGYSTPLRLFDDGQILLNDGSFIMLENPTGSLNLLISVDVNGYQKGPNRWGNDLFTFKLMPNGQLLPYGHPQTGNQAFVNNYCSTSATYAYNGMTCTYKALTESNYFKKLPR